MKGLVAYVAQALVDAPDEVRVTEFANESKTVIKLQVVQEDLGKVIGKKGRTAKAIRTVLSAAGLLLDKKTQLEIVE
ncbi:MAG: KH domain-containing protein [Myxococcota bacterium]